MVKLVNTRDLKSLGLIGLAGSSPAARTKTLFKKSDLPMASSKEKSHIVECIHCDGKIEAVVRGEFEFFDPDFMDLPSKHSLLECKICHSPILVIQEYDPNFDEWDDPNRIYPADDRRLGLSVPRSIRAAYHEAGLCFKVKSYTACAIMCRKILEGVCVEHSAKGPNLSAKLSWLKKQGLIDERLSEWAKELRLMGNEAAHDVNVTFDRQDAEDALDFSEALTEYLFTFREKFKEFKKRRAKKKK